MITQSKSKEDIYLRREKRMKEEKKLSIIIPNYNSGRLLQKCVESIVKSIDENIEVIIVDDGSNDDSINGVSNLSACIKIVKQSNQGVSKARNTGLKTAKGEYVMFVDADDTLNSNWLLHVRKEIKFKKDLVIFNYTKNGSPTKIVNESKSLNPSQINLYKNRMLQLPTLYLTVWGKLIKRSIIANSNLMFDERIKMAEDGDFMIQCLSHIQSISLDDFILYNYENNSDSVMRTFSNDKVENYLESLNITSKKISLNNSLREGFKFYVLMHLNVMMVHEVFDVENDASYFEKRKELKKILKLNLMRNALSKINIKQCKYKQMIPIILLKLKLYDIAALSFYLRSIQNHRN